MPSTNINIIKWLGFRSRKMNETDSFMALILHWVYHTKGNNIITNDTQWLPIRPPTSTNQNMFWIVVDWHLRTSMKGTAKAFVMSTHEAFVHERRSTHQVVAPLCISWGNWKMDHPGRPEVSSKSWHNDRLWLWQSLQHGTSMHKCKSGQPKFNMLSCGERKKNTSTHKGHGPLSVANFTWREVLKKAKSNKPTTLKKLLVLLTHSFDILINNSLGLPTPKKYQSFCTIRRFIKFMVVSSVSPKS